jgi:hypothetical protein
LNKRIQGDAFKLEKEFMIELEEMSNESKDGKMCAEAKAIIVENMLVLNQQVIAINYVKKAMLKFAGNN